MLFLRLKQAQCALEEGRLDEAFELARATDVRNHRQGQLLIGRLVERLVERGRGHLAAQRFAPAFTDCTKAEHLGGNLTAVAELRSAITQAVEERQRLDRRQALAEDAARKQIDNGQLSLGERLLADANPTDQAKLLVQQAAVRRMEVETYLTQARNALSRDDLELAMAQLLRAKKAQAQTDAFTDLVAKVSDQAVRRVQAAMDEGRLDTAEALLDPLVQLQGEKIAVRELQRTLNDCRRAAELIGHGQLAPACRLLKQAAAVLPAAWLKDAAAEIERAARTLEELQSGPLGLVGTKVPCGRSADPPNMGTTEEPAVETQSSTVLPERFLIRMDAVGSFLVVRKPRVVIGPISSPLRPDVALVANPSLPAVSIERVEEDYFVTTDGQASARLMRDGEAIPLGLRGQLRLTRPHPASTSAVVQLSGVQLPQGDVRQVILLDREIIVGTAAASHIRVGDLTEPVVLYIQDGRFLCRTGLPVAYNERTAAPGQAIPMDTHVRIGPVSFTVTKA